jgi:hypothetical protein
MRGVQISKKERDELFGNEGKLRLLSDLNQPDDVIITKDDTHYNFYFIGPCDTGIYDKEHDECLPLQIPIISGTNKKKYNPFSKIRKNKRKIPLKLSPTSVIDTSSLLSQDSSTNKKQRTI